MTISDAQRHRLHTKLDQVLGEEDAAVLISHLPPSGWSDVARARDLDQLEARLELRLSATEQQFDHRVGALEDRLDARFAVLDARFDAMESKFDATLERALREQTNRFFLGIGAMVSILAALQALLS